MCLGFTYNPRLGHFLFKIVGELWSKSAFIGLLLKTQGVRRVLFLKPYKDYWVFRLNNVNLLTWLKRNPLIHNQPLKLLWFLNVFVWASEELHVPKPLERDVNKIELLITFLPPTPQFPIVSACPSMEDINGFQQNLLWASGEVAPCLICPLCLW